MYRSTIAAVAIAGFLSFGCEKKTETEKAADNNAAAVKDKLDEVKEKSKDGTAEAKKTAENMSDSAKEGAGNVQSEITSLVSKAKDAVKAAKWDDAENYVKQIDDLKAKLPEGARAPIDDMIGEIRKGIDAGKKMSMPKM